ncbi:MAG TPA: LamG-like jellyroll fold domain-containing protein, partial [Clostridia bacterium]|nr:LamG-like jellyroll fold domain-containing protein [Clostridia bacterium]
TSEDGVVAEAFSTTLVATGVWYHVAGVRGPNTIEIYVNGVLERQTNVNFPQDYSTRPLFFGSSGESWDRKFSGTLDEVSLYDRALTAGEIASLYEAGSAGKSKQPRLLSEPAGGVRYWGDSITLAAAAAGVAPLNYAWEKDGAQVPGASNALLVFNNLQVTNSGDYLVTIANAHGSVTSAPANLLVKVADVSVAYTEADPDRIAEVTIGGLTGQTYGILAADSPDATNWLSITNLTLTSPTNVWTDIQPLAEPQRYYRVVEGPIDLPIPPIILVQPKSQMVTTGLNATLSVTAAGKGPLTYAWNFFGTNLAASPRFVGLSEPALTINGLTIADTGGYSVIVSNDFGAVTSSVAALTVMDCPVPLPGIVGWWPGDGSARDIVGTNHGILRGGATADTNAWIGTGFSFDGTNKYVEIPDAPELKPQELSVECWVRFDNLDAPGTSIYVGQQYLVYKQNSRYDNFEGYVLSKDRTYADIILWEVTSSEGELVRIDSLTVMETNVWHHLVGVRGSNYIQLYVNGVLEAQTNVNFPQDYGTNSVYFGTSGQAYWDRRLNGVLDEVLLYNRALSAEEIAGLYAQGATSKCKWPSITPNPEGGSRYKGAEFTFLSGAQGAQPIAYQWEKDGVPLLDATNAVLALSSLELDQAGSYVFTASNAYGAATSPPALLDVELADLFLEPFVPGSSNGFGLDLVGTPGQVLGIQATSDLSLTNGWFGLTNFTLLGTTNLWLDPTPPSEPARFYRIVPGPISVP